MFGWLWSLLSLFYWCLGVVYFIIKLGFVILFIVLFILWKYQGAILYQRHAPDRRRQIVYNPFDQVRNPNYYRMNYDDFFILTKDRVNIHCWLLRQDNSRDCSTVIMFHGNAGNIGYRLPNACYLYRHLGCNVLMVDYRGYGNSEGIPTELGLIYDAEACLSHLMGRDDINHQKIFLLGSSLGGAVAIDLAYRCSTGKLQTLPPGSVEMNTMKKSPQFNNNNNNNNNDIKNNNKNNNNTNNNNNNTFKNTGVNRSLEDTNESSSSSFGNSNIESETEKLVGSSQRQFTNQYERYNKNSNSHGHKIRISGVIVENTFTSIVDMLFVILDEYLLLGSKITQQGHVHSHSHTHNPNHQHTLGSGLIPENLRTIAKPPNMGDSTGHLDTTIRGMDQISNPPRTKSFYDLFRVENKQEFCRKSLHFFFHYFISNRWLSVYKAYKITCPILFLSGLKDELVPPKQMAHLYQRCKESGKSPLCVMKTYPNGDHNATWQRGGQKYYDDILEFIQNSLMEDDETDFSATPDSRHIIINDDQTSQDENGDQA